MKVIVVSGVLIHVVLLLSIFDIYFKSPIINNVEPYQSRGEAPAKRVVLFIADGLRAATLYKTKDTAWEDIMYVTPYLGSVAKQKGTMGISRTRVPTESRPGHIALTAGFYEDPSCVLKGWKENSVEFDTIFNRSSFSWAWGSPDIVPMFARGLSQDHIYIDSYDADDEDFSGSKSTTLLDEWVFTKVEQFLRTSAYEKGISEKLANDKNVFLLHLLGLDTAGHTHKPNAKEYMENIYVVDKGIERMVRAFEYFFKDGKTAYLFTSDHGMTDWGSHGAGSLHETETPIIAWGAGIRHNSLMLDIEQADVTPLMATLIGVPIPVNSMGVLPIEYLELPQRDIALGIYANAQQVCSVLNEKRRRVENTSWRLFFKPFVRLTPDRIHSLSQDIEQDIQDGSYAHAIKQSRWLIEIAKIGLDYYQNYYQKLLLTCTSLSYVGWILYLLSNILSKKSSNHDDDESTTDEWIKSKWKEYCSNCWLHGSFTAALLFGLFALISQRMPFMYYLYCLLPIIVWWNLFIQLEKCEISMRAIKFHDVYVYLGWALLYILGAEMLVFSFFERRVLSLPLLVMSVWPYIHEGQRMEPAVRIVWLFSCLTLAVFPLLPVIGSYNSAFAVIVQMLLWILVGVTILRACYPIERQTTTDNVLLHAVLGIYVLAFLNTIFIEICNVYKIGLPLFNQTISWMLLISSFILPLFASLYVQSRLTFVKLSLAVPVLLLSASYEPIFLLVLFINLYTWLLIEDRLGPAARKDISEIQFAGEVHKEALPWFDGENLNRMPVGQEDFRKAYYVLFYVILSFFGTGNIASVNSFDPTWVRNFVTVFSPFTMAALILVKIIIPFLVVSCTFRALTVAVKAPTSRLFLIVLMLGDMMGLQFLYFVRNEGSWLEIGTSISHYVIVQSIVVFLIILYCIAILLTESEFTHFKHYLKKRE